MKRRNEFNKCAYFYNWANQQAGCDCCAYTKNQKYNKKYEEKKLKNAYLALAMR
jgi:hypothetical protein